MNLPTSLARLLGSSLLLLALIAMAGPRIGFFGQKAAAGGASASDSFDRPDGSLGPNWIKPMASEHNLIVIGNQVGVDVEDSHNYAFWASNSFGDDQYSQITLTKIGPWTGVILRADASVDRFYIGFVFGPSDYRIYSRWDGGYYLLSSGNATTWQLGDTFRMEIKGSTNPITATLYQNGNPVLSWTSTVPAEVRTGGSPGIGIYSPAGENLTLDNWEGGQLD